MLLKIKLFLLFFLSSLPAMAADGFYVEDGKLMDANGNQFVMRGLSNAHIWFDKDAFDALTSIAALKANAVRIVWTMNGSASRLDQIMQKCIDLKMIPIPELHDVTGNNDASRLNDCANWWVKPDVKALFNKYRKEAILNIANEWMSMSNDAAYKSAYINAIAIIRNAGIKNTILVDAGGYGQGYSTVLNTGLEILAADPLKNTIFAVHMYGQYSTAQKVQSAIRSINDKKIPLIIGEFGWKHSDGDVAEEAILSECKDLKIGFLAWSWKGNSGGVEYLDLSTTWNTTTGLSDWGNTVFTSANGILNTSVTCSIFNGTRISSNSLRPVYQSKYTGAKQYSLTGRLINGNNDNNLMFHPASIIISVENNHNCAVKRSHVLFMK